MANIVYCILAHKEPEQICRLINRLQTPNDRIHVHFDTSIGKERFADWERLIERNCKDGNFKVVSEFQCKWGSFGIIDAMLSAMKRYEKVDYDYFINLSGECYPLRAPKIIKKELDDRKCAFIEVFKMPLLGWRPDGGMERLQKRWYILKTMKYPHAEFYSIPRLRKELPNKLTPYGGSAWFCLPKAVVSYIISFLEKNSSLRNYFRRVLIPDEIMFQTILMNSPFKSSTDNDNKRYIDWNGGGSRHPRILRITDFEKMKNSGKLFARKFDYNVDREILDRIDKEIEAN